MNFQAFFKRWKELALFALVAGILEQTFMLMIFYVFEPSIENLKIMATVLKTSAGFLAIISLLLSLYSTVY